MNVLSRIGLVGLATFGFAGAALASQPIQTTTTLSFNSNPIAAGTPAVITATVTRNDTGAAVTEGKVILRYYTLNNVYTSCETIGALANNFPGAWYAPAVPNSGGGTLNGLGKVIGNFDTTGLAGMFVGFEAQYIGGNFASGHFGGSTSDCLDLHIVNPCRPVQEGDGATKSKGFYGHAQDSAAFMSSVPYPFTVGNGYVMTFSSSTTLTGYFAHGGTPMQLTQSWIDPLQSQAGGTFGQQVAALKLNLMWDSLNGHGQLGSMEIHDATSAFDGMTVSEFLANAETVLGGGNLLSGTTLGQTDNNGYNWVATQLNEAFDEDLNNNGQMDASAWAMQYLFICG